MHRLRFIVFMTLALAFVFTVSFSSMAAAATPAPPGSYTATLGETVIKGAGKSMQKGEGRFERRMEGPGAGQTITINITSYSTQDEMNQLVAAQQNPEEFMKILGGFDHGSVQMGEKSIPINFAISNKAGNLYGIQLLSSRPFSEMGHEGMMMKGARTGYIRMTVDENGNGDGVLYRSTSGVNLTSSGEVNAQAGIMKSTELKDIKRR